jgi:hypothetical protein
VTQTKFDNKIKIVLGKLQMSQKSLEIFDGRVVDFLNEIFINIKKNKSATEFSDLQAFGFWCRKANIKKLSNNYERNELVLGRGNVFHIAPSNVPMTFAYSFVFGMLSGNNNIVRLPSRNFVQVEILCQIISKILKKSRYVIIKKKICFIKYKKSNEISAYLSKEVDARLIWGGDKTINQFKKFDTSPRCIDLSFSDRYSISIVNSDKVEKLKQEDIKNLANKFYNDCYLMDQQGCSSPQAIFWIGKKNNQIKKVFWKHLSKIIDSKYDSDLSIANQKITSLSRVAIESDINFNLEYKNFKLIKLKVKSSSKNIESLKCHFGTFAEIEIGSLNELKNTITKKFQTITYFGIDTKKIEKFILDNNISGIDRLVPVGRAFDIGPIWDGYDIIYSLSRIVGK